MELKARLDDNPPQIGASEDCQETCCGRDRKNPDQSKQTECCSSERDALANQAGCCGGQSGETAIEHTIGEDTDSCHSPCCGGNDESFECDIEEEGVGGCCGGDENVESQGKNAGCCGRNSEDSHLVPNIPDSDDNLELEDSEDPVCDCCIKFLVKGTAEAATRTAGSSYFPLKDAAESAIACLQTSTRILRACCQVLEQYCCEGSCCFASTSAGPKPSARTAPKCHASSTKEVEPSALNAPAKDAGSGEGLRLEIRGMDCADCAPKVLRALTQLPSVNSTIIDYFSGIVDLRYDPEVLTASAIAAYVARATGFGVRPVTDTAPDGGPHTITLPLSFAIIPPPDTFKDVNAHPTSNPHIVEISFPVHQDLDQQPRDVLAKFQPFGAELLPSQYRAELGNPRRDFILVATRTAACVVLSIPVLVLAWAKLSPRPVLYGAISLSFTTGIQAIGSSIISSAIRSVVYLHQVDLSVLVAISTLTAYTFSVIAYAFEVSGNPFSAPFFETSALLVTLILLGRTIAAATRRSTGSALRELERLQPDDVVLTAKNEPVQTLDSRLLHYGDIIRISPDTRIATDGIVVGGSSDVDEASITGESVAVPKEIGNHVIAGTLNLNGTLDIQVTCLIHENSLSRVKTLVKHAQMSRLPVQDLADRLSRWILPAATISACVAFLLWGLIGRYVLHLSPTSTAIQAITYVIAIFIVSCPCAIGLAVPMVVSRAIRIGLQEGVLFRSLDTLQTANDITTVVFDKTGTLSQGHFTVEQVKILVEGAEPLINALVENNKHPISQGVYKYLNSQHCDKTHSQGMVEGVISLPGKGIKATIRGFPLLGGSPSFTGACTHPLALELQSTGLSLFSVTLAGQAIAFFGLTDTPRPNAHTLVAELLHRGKQVMIMSGDTPSAVHRLANTIGIVIENTFAAYTPEDKDSAIVGLQGKGQRVCFVGDGTNDAPALSRADVSLAIGAGSDVALGAAGAVLIGSDLRRGVLAFLDIATATRMHCYLALAWCVFYNVFAILLASGAFVKVRIEPRWAGIGEVVSVVPVVAISFMLDLLWR